MTYRSTCNLSLQLRPDGIFATKNNHDKDRSLMKKWDTVIYECVRQFNEFWDRFLKQYAFGCPNSVCTCVDLS